ncbi:hypothetical protein CDAR_201371 [Caerostris darwini]|uniref:Uncharacterized protein n=1 Tax=Caerostris darwini TaxID=1538125 RepID=A0AAV4RZ89_9ARAC|nr:hypothetical protein CDAR_201371 [Caerostris darwini]
MTVDSRLRDSAKSSGGGRGREDYKNELQRSSRREKKKPPEEAMINETSNVGDGIEFRLTPRFDYGISPITIIEEKIKTPDMAEIMFGY